MLSLTYQKICFNGLKKEIEVQEMQKIKEIFDKHYPTQWLEFQNFGRKLQEKIHYNFTTEETLWQALSIRGSKLPTEIFERLEFLGDSVLKAILGISLYDKGSTLNPNDLTSLRALLESNEHLSSIAKGLDYDSLGQLLGAGTLSQSQASDSLESLIGAIYIDLERNFDKTAEIVKIFIDIEKAFEIQNTRLWGAKDPKSFLNEWIQKKYKGSAELKFVSTNKGTGNTPQYYVGALIVEKNSNKTLHESTKVGPASKVKDGEKQAAEMMLTQLQQTGELKP